MGLAESRRGAREVEEVEEEMQRQGLPAGKTLGDKLEKSSLGQERGLARLLQSLGSEEESVD